jgi:GT2 family glycosyltransferase
MTDAQAVHVAILVVSYRGEPYLRDCLNSIRHATHDNLILHPVVVDNASPDQTSSLIQTEYPHVHLVQSQSNLGFAGGNNLGWQYIQSHLPQVEYVMLLNQDARLGDQAIEPLITFMQSHPNAASVQPAIMLHDDPTLLNTAGNQSHYLGFGIKTGYRKPIAGPFAQPRQLDFASGCAVMLRRDLLGKHGLFADDLFMYLEDAQLGWMYRILGYENWYLPETTVIHQYRFSSTLNSYQLLERNRWWMLRVFYRWPTLLLLMPALLLMELGQLAYALSEGCLGKKLASYCAKNRQARQAMRQFIQSHRVISDRQLTANFTSQIPAEELKHWALQGIANPLFTLYWKIARLFLWW